MDLPKFAIVMKNENGYWDVLSMEGLTTYEKAKAKMEYMRSNVDPDCYMVALNFIAGPGSEI